MTRAADLRSTFLRLHQDPPASGTLVMPNPFDVGSAKLLVRAGAPALATTSSGAAATTGRLDGDMSRDEVVAHAREMAAATDAPLNVDSEDGFGDTVDDVVVTARALAATDAAGFSIEDWSPRRASIRDFDDAVARITAAKEAGRDLILTARAENHLHGVDDLDDTVARLQAYRAAGADVVYAPGLVDRSVIRRVVEAVDAPVNVLALPTAPTIPELAELGVARVSIGGLAAWAAYGAVWEMACELFSTGASDYAARILPPAIRNETFAQ
ncbi:MAG: isocitrate lyase/phosphoenolpyruvate mutase family protein [Actinomycetota bacterium]